MREYWQVSTWRHFTTIIMPWNMVDSCSQLRLEIVWDKSSGLNWIWGIKTQNSSSIWLKVFTAATRYMILEGYFVSYFQKILEGSNSEMVLDSSMLSGALPIISSSKHVSWLSPITDEEIKKTLFSLKDNKAPGLDGFSVGFFKKSWSMSAWTLLMLVDLSSLVAGFSSK